MGTDKDKFDSFEGEKSGWMDVTSIQNWINSAPVFSKRLRCNKDDADLLSYDVWETGKAITLDINSQQLINMLHRDFKRMLTWGSLICRFTAVYCLRVVLKLSCMPWQQLKKIYVTVMEVYITQRTTSNWGIKSCLWVLWYAWVRRESKSET